MCKTLTTIQLQAVYRQVSLGRYRSLRSFNKFFETIIARPELANFVSNFTFKVEPGYSKPTENLSNELTVTPESIRSCFRLFRNLEALNLDGEAILALPSLLTLLTSDSLPPKCTSIRVGIPAKDDTTLLTLPSSLQTLEITFLGGISAWLRNDPERLDLPPLPALSSLTISRPDARQQAYRQLVSRCSNLRSFELRDLAPQWNRNPASLEVVPEVDNITSLTITAKARERTGRRNFLHQFNVDSYLSKFSNVKHLTLGAGTSPHLVSFFNELRKLPLESLTFAAGEYVPLPPLVDLVSSSTRHLTLRTLTLSFLEENGKMGTRIAEVDVVFEEADVDSESVEEDYMTDNWTMPSFPPGLTVAALLTLQQVGAQNGVVVDGKVFEAIEIEQAYDDDVELLNEMWENWRKKEKKSKGKKGGRGRK